MTKQSEISNRAQVILKALIERYIQDGQPVSSNVLAMESGLNLSPATVRNVMSDLEEMGLIISPHTSAGRVPTASGYRLFVDTMLTVQKLELEDIQQLEQQFVSAVSPSDLVKNTSNILSGITSMAGVVMLPKREQLLLKQIEFLPLSEKRVLVVLVVNSCEVQNRIIQADCEFSASELQQASNFINHHYVGKDLREIRQATLKEMRNSREHMNELMIKAVEMADMALDGTQQEDGCVVAGQTNLMHYAEMADMGKLRQLFEAFNQQQSILYLLDQSINAEGVQIFIGEESGYEVFDSCSVVTSPYKSGDEVVGVLGVIGPTRMAYDRMIPIVDVTAKLLGAALNSQD